MDRATDVLIIGAGQAGLAMSRQLSEEGIEHILLERNSTIGESWCRRYEMLRTITPNWMNGLPGKPFPGPRDAFATRDEVVDYLVDYAADLGAPILFNHAVTHVAKTDNGFVVETPNGRFGARQVVVATGPFQKPRIPALAANYEGFQIHYDEFVSDRQLPPGSVLVVGSGNSGVHVAADLSASRDVWLSRERDATLPRRLSGKEFQGLLDRFGIADRGVPQSLYDNHADLMWWMQEHGLYDMQRDSAFGRLLVNGPDPYIGDPIATVAAQHQFSLLPRVVDATAGELEFEDGAHLSPDVLIWATGYRFDLEWTKGLAVTDGEGLPIHVNGVSPVAGFYFLGLRWMQRADSGLLKGVGRDAAFLCGAILRRHDLAMTVET